MHIPNYASLIFLAYLLIVLPWLAIRSAGVFRTMKTSQAADSRPVREAIWYRTIVTQCLMFAFAWLVGRTFDYQIFGVSSLSPNYYVAAGGALVALLILRAVIRATRSEQERRGMVVYYLAPRTTREWFLKSAAVLIASISEEACYRGVGFAIVWYATGSALIAALLCAIAFALAHWIQGWKSMIVIFGIALVTHGLVYYTQTLVLAMVVHALYDFIAIYLIWKESVRLGLNK